MKIALMSCHNFEKSKTVWIDDYDPAWKALLGEKVFFCQRSQEFLESQIENFDIVILPGRGDLFKISKLPVDQMRDQSDRAIIERCQQLNKKLIGVCRGSQIINDFFGGALKSKVGHVGTEHPLRKSNAKWSGPETIVTNSFHNYGIAKDDLASALTPLYQDEQGDIEVFAGAKFFGVMWHPERSGNDKAAMDLWRAMLNE